MNVYVDPGKHASGVAWYLERQLYKVAYRSEPLPYSGAVRCVCEKPVVRRGSRVRPADLIDLAIAAGRMTANLPTTYITPESWKGQIPCTCSARTQPEDCPHHRRMVNVLSSAEWGLLCAVDCPRALLHNVYDAVTMGLKFEGRLA